MLPFKILSSELRFVKDPGVKNMPAISLTAAEREK
jgi:hypothetical protein